MTQTDSDELHEFLSQDPVRNYFALLALEKGGESLRNAYIDYADDGSHRGMLLQRKTGTLQFYGRDDCDYAWFASKLQHINWKRIVGCASQCDRFLENSPVSSISQVALISSTDKTNVEVQKYGDWYTNVKPSMLEEVALLHTEVFGSHCVPHRVMRDRLNSGTSRGVCFPVGGRIASIAMTAYETKDSACIVGVATNPYDRGQGLASALIQNLTNKLVMEGKTVYLQYDNEAAGRIYTRLGFEPYDVVKDYQP